jgi:threonine/homoserine/homoserine lactone efflux protein
MHLVICTGIGLVGVALIMGATFLFLWSLAGVTDWAERHLEFPRWAEWLGGILAIAFVVAGLLFGAHEIGCKIVHLVK